MRAHLAKTAEDIEAAIGEGALDAESSRRRRYEGHELLSGLGLPGRDLYDLPDSVHVSLTGRSTGSRSPASKDRGCWRR